MNDLFACGRGDWIWTVNYPPLKRWVAHKDKVPIIYDPVNPTENVRINTFEILWLGPTFLTGAGVFVVILSLGLH